jgi:hypothetical protein
MCTSPSTHPTEEGTTKREAHGTKLVALRDSLRARRAECPTRTRVANISGPSSHRSSVPHRFGVAYDANPSGFQTQRFRSEGCSRLWSRSRSGPCPLPTPVRVGTTTSKSYISAHCSLRSSARVRRGGQGARSFTEGFARIGSPTGMGVAQMWAMPQGLRGCTRYKSGLKVRRPFVDHVASVRHRSHKLVSAIVAF